MNPSETFKTRKIMKCPSCKQEIPAGTKLCPYCGTPLNEETVATVESQSQPVGPQGPSQFEQPGYQQPYDSAEHQHYYNPQKKVGMNSTLVYTLIILVIAIVIGVAVVLLS